MVRLVSINYLFLVPIIVFTIPPIAIFQQSIPITLVIASVGIVGMTARKGSLVSLASLGLLLLIVWGKVAGDLYGLPGPDTAVLLFQFILVVFFMEASATTLTLRVFMKQLENKMDEFSVRDRIRVTNWAKAQLMGLAKLTIGAFVLSLGLVVLGSIVSVSVNQLALAGLFVLGVVIAIFFLLTYRREPR